MIKECKKGEIQLKKVGHYLKMKTVFLFTFGLMYRLTFTEFSFL